MDGGDSIEKLLKVPTFHVQVVRMNSFIHLIETVVDVVEYFVSATKAWQAESIEHQMGWVAKQTLKQNAAEKIQINI